MAAPRSVVEIDLHEDMETSDREAIHALAQATSLLLRIDARRSAKAMPEKIVQDSNLSRGKRAA